MDLELERQEDVTVFWDFNCTQDSSAASTISTSAMVKNICTAVSPYGPLKSIRLYWDHAGYPIQPATTRIRSEFSASGVCLIDCPADGRKEGAMKKMLVDLIIHAWDHETGPHTYVVITTDRDVAYALSRLRMKEYRIILLSPAWTHSDLTSQATIQLDWTKSILGLTSLPHTDLRDIPAATSSAAEAHQPSTSRLRAESLSGNYHESGEPNPESLPPGRPSSSPSLAHTTRIYGISNGLGPGPTFPRTPPRASTWSVSGDAAKAKATVRDPISSNSMPSGRTDVNSTGIAGDSFKEPLNNPRPTFDPFDDPDEWPRPSFSGSGNGRTRMESVTPSSESTGSSETGFSLVNPQPVSTALTSAEEEWKPTHPKPQSPAAGTVDLGITSGNVTTSQRPEANEGIEGAAQSDSMPIQTATLRAPLVKAPLPTTTPAPMVLSQPSINTRAISPGVTQMWNPLINTLRQNGGTIPYIALPPKLLKSYPGAYGLAGRSKYKQYIQLAVESGIVIERMEDVQLTASYM